MVVTGVVSEELPRVGIRGCGRLVDFARGEEAMTRHS